MTTYSDDDVIAVLREALPAGNVELQKPLPGSQNRHAIVRFPDRKSWFVKLYADRSAYDVEKAVLGALGARLPWPVRPLAGDDDGPFAWQAFPFVRLKEVLPSAAAMREWGSLLADVHACAPPPGLERSARAVDLVDERLARLARVDLPSAETAQELWLRARDTVGRDAAAHHEPARLLTHDFGFRNAFRRPDTTMLLIDFERAGMGDPHWDLGKAWDRELRQHAGAFLTAYHKALPGTDEWPHGPTLWVTRFAAALAAVPYALRVGDIAFRQEAYAVLQRLRSELPKLEW